MLNLDRTVLGFLSLAACAALGWAQETSPQPPGPDPVDTEEAEQRVPRIPGEVESFSPRDSADRQPIRPGLTSGESWTTLLNEQEAESSPRRLPERSFLNALRGEVVAGPHGTLIFVYPEESEVESSGIRSDNAMLLLPCAVLERFDEFSFKRNERVPALVSGQVFGYDGRNYLLPSVISPAIGSAPAAAKTPPTVEDDANNADDEQPGIKTPANSEADDGTTSSDSTVRSSDVDRLIESLNRRPVYNRRRARAEDSGGDNSGRGGDSGQTAADAEGTTGTADAAMTIPDGKYIQGRRGRVVRSLDGSWVFVSDSEQGDGLRLTLLPCRMLARLERIVLREGDSSAVMVSGRVYTFRGDGYLLPTLFERERRAGVDPLQ